MISLRKSRRKQRASLPPIPLGNEALDMLWRDTAYLAADLLLDLPYDASPDWATPKGTSVFTHTVLRHLHAQKELERTARESPLSQVRQRTVQREAALSKVQARLIAAAFVPQIRREFPDAEPEQVWLLIAAKFRAASEAWANEPDASE